MCSILFGQTQAPCATCGGRPLGGGGTPSTPGSPGKQVLASLPRTEPPPASPSLFPGTSKLAESTAPASAHTPSSSSSSSSSMSLMPGSSPPKLSQSVPEVLSWSAGPDASSRWGCSCSCCCALCCSCCKSALPNGLWAWKPARKPAMASRSGLGELGIPLPMMVAELMLIARLPGKLLRLVLTLTLPPVAPRLLESNWSLPLPPFLQLQLPALPLPLPLPEPTNKGTDDVSPSAMDNSPPGWLEASNVVVEALTLVCTETVGRDCGEPSDGNAASASSGGPCMPNMCASMELLSAFAGSSGLNDGDAVTSASPTNLLSSAMPLVPLPAEW